MKSFTKPLLFGVLAIGVSASYGNDAPVVTTPCTTATPVTPVPQYQSTSEAPPPPPPVYTTPAPPPPVYSVSSSPPPPVSSAPPEVTCPEPSAYVASCAYLCKGSNAVAYCSGTDVTDTGSGTTCTPCGGAPAPSTEPVYTPPPPPKTEEPPTPEPSTEPAYTPPPPVETEPVYTAPPSTLSTAPSPVPTPETCPYGYTASCAYICTGGSQKVAKCFDKDISSDDEGAVCTPCGGSPVPPPNNNTTTPVYPPPPSNTTIPPPPNYNSGATALNIGTAAIFGLICMMFTL
ncbi:hypothetical protein TWF106_008084 [Orbilia oligospora]|uniref:Uncharacterized protein n=1 Tax=Orbilia oligospora TaxID=2813651 RepID=A0A6G1LYK0_ORBOL|nr:hypothetical protein TWF788_008774 [Orbilia oligospora]KAF3214859.1 hypothetical protein TWF679_004637 [Orbilia oligospora]KAF3217035.1 hypothetical protein TWF106_008084 [Orbilia oligospora]KAF3239049.1 hypothetical protein TWF192_010126 [Orbilia oligospora]